MPTANIAQRVPALPPFAGPSPDVLAARPFRLPLPKSGPLSRGWGARAIGAVERLLAVDRLNDVYARSAAAQNPDDFLRRVLDTLAVSFRLPAEDLARIPRSGPLMVVANHPFGAIDGLILAAVLRSVRPDVRVMANRLLAGIPHLRELFLFVDPFGGPEAAASNLAPMRQSMRWLRDGGVLAAFPAGEVAHLNWRDLSPGNLKRMRDGGWRAEHITDPKWNDTIARIVRRTGVPVLPIYFDGCNGAMFQLLGLLHPRLRTAMLPREVFRKRDACVRLRVGSVIAPKRLAALPGEAELSDYLRRRTFLLQHGAAPKPSTPAPEETVVSPAVIAPPSGGRLRNLFVPRPAPGVASTPEPIVGPVDPTLLAADVAGLPSDAIIVDGDDLVAYAARAPQIRNVLRELGRLREVTFRAVGEGTGRSIDLDTFDYDYLHLFIWSKARGEVVGAYRLGATDELLPAKGRLGLYTSTLFNYEAELLRRLDPALEMGRSFVRAEYQRSFAPLLLLWKGIGHYCVRHPRYRYVFGPVSISNRYQTVSQQLMVQFLKSRHGMPDGEALARPHHPFRLRPPAGWDDASARASLCDSDDVSAVVADLEPDQKGIPILIKQYLKLGAKFLEFNVDPAFCDAVDGLIVVDLFKTEARVLERYMTKPGHKSFCDYQRSVIDRAPRVDGSRARV